jgi:hypothetical protein
MKTAVAAMDGESKIKRRRLAGPAEHQTTKQ